MKYKVTIEEINEREVEKTEEKVFNKKTGDIISWSKWYALSDEEKEDYDKRQIPTGVVETETSEKKVYEQEVEDLDLGELAIYINRAI